MSIIVQCNLRERDNLPTKDALLDHFPIAVVTEKRTISQQRTKLLIPKMSFIQRFHFYVII